jgi:hypothetical protein
MVDNPTTDPNLPEMSIKDFKHMELAAYVLGFAEEWRNFRDTEYDTRFTVWENMANSVFSENDRTREMERSKLVTPLSMQAIRSVNDEISEAVLQSGELGMLVGENTPEFAKAREEFRRRLMKDGWVQHMGRAIDIGSTYGSAFAELCQDRTTEYTLMDQDNLVGVSEDDRERIKPRIWSPRQVLVDYTVDDIADSQGIIFEEFVGEHIISTKMAEGIYKSVPLGIQEAPDRVLTDPTRQQRKKGVQLLRWYGKVPRDLIKYDEDEGSEYLGKSDEDKLRSGFVEAYVHLVNGEVVLCAENPTMRKSRGVEHYKFETIAGRLLGRGIPESGLMMQAACDGAIRAHMDSLAITSVPVTASDSTKLPKGFNFKLYAGRNIPVSGDIDGAIKRLDLGSTDPALLGTSQTFERLFMQATGTMDSGVLPDLVKGGTDPTALVIAMAALIRRNRQRVLNFQNDFLIPLMEETYYRYVQFDPDSFPSLPPTFEVVSTVGLLEREFETSRLMKLGNTLGPESVVMHSILEQVVGLSNTRNRETMLIDITEAKEKLKNDPQKAEEAARQAAMQLSAFQLEIEKAKAEVSKLYQEAKRIQIETELAPRLAQAEIVGSLSKNIRDKAPADEFERRVKIFEMMMKEEELNIKKSDVDSNERIAMAQLGRKTDGVSLPEGPSITDTMAMPPTTTNEE